MMRSFARWLFMRTHHQELKHCAAYARGTRGRLEQDAPPSPSHSIGMLDALEILELLA